MQAYFFAIKNSTPPPGQGEHELVTDFNVTHKFVIKGNEKGSMVPIHENIEGCIFQNTWGGQLCFFFN